MKKVVVLMGGLSREREVSIASGSAVAQALQEVAQENNLEVEARIIDGPQDITAQAFAGVDVVFNLMHGVFGEDGQLQTLLEDLDVAYTGARAKSSRIAFDKIKSKKCFEKANVSTPFYQTLELTSELVIEDLAAPILPCVVKPPREGSSFGVFKVTTQQEWVEALKELQATYDEVLIEQWIEGRELTVGILGTEVFPIVEIVPENGFYDSANKYPWLIGDGGAKYFCPAHLDAEVTAQVQQQALAAHQSVGVEVYSRVDVLLDEDLQPYVLEINTLPGMTQSSLLPKSGEIYGLSFTELCLRIIKDSM